MDTPDAMQDFRAKYYNSLWRNAWGCLRESKRVVFVGFSFPQTNFHAAALFQSAYISGVGFDRVVFCHRGDTNTFKTMQRVFSGRTDKTALFTEFDEGLEVMVTRQDELLAVLDVPC